MANFVNFPEPMGQINMDYVSQYLSDEQEGIFGINVTQANGTIKFVPFVDETTRNTFMSALDANFLLAT